MHPATSVYLDAVRFLASLTVFVYHFTSWTRFGFGLHVPNAAGHNAVLVFFVLSGYVIAYVAQTRENDSRVYLVSRLARLWSVCVPALLLTLVLDSVGMRLAPQLYDANSHTDIVVRMLGSLLFINQLWNLTISPLSNGPYWSVTYEFWYYLLFWAMLFLRAKTRLITLVFLCLIAGPRILILMPVWLLGVWIYRQQHRGDFDGMPWILVFPLALAATGWLMFVVNPADALTEQVKALFPDGYVHVFGLRLFLGAARSFPADYLFCAVFALTILSSHSFFRHFRRRARLIAAIRICASFTFSLYLYHYPLLLFFQALLDHNPQSAISIATLGIATLTCVVGIARYTEHRKDFVHRAIDSLIDRHGKALAGAQRLLLHLRRSD